MSTPIPVLPGRTTRMMFVAPPHGAALAEAAPIARVLLAERTTHLLDGLAQGPGQPLRVQVAGVATSYAHTLYLAGQVGPDVVVLGCFPDPLDVLDVVGALRSLSKCSVLVHGLNDPARADLARHNGAAEVLGSPSTAPDVLQSIQRLCAARRPAVTAVARLTVREKQLITAIVTNPGAKYLVIGAQLGISEHTVHNHLSHIYHKLNLVNRSDLLLYAVHHRIVADASRTQ